MRNRIFVLTCLLAGSVYAGPQEHPAPVLPKEFDQLKSLVGEWEGTATTDGKQETFKATYELTSGGTVLIEKLMVGQPHEMVTTFYAEGKDVALTHYCAMGNHPTMKLKKSDAKTAEFSMAKMDGRWGKEPHMHGLKISWIDPTHIQEDWSLFEKGKLKGSTTLTLVKKK